jgi:hypothetical protein
MSDARIPPSRAAALLIGVGVLNLVITAFVAMMSARSWGQLPELRGEVAIVAPGREPSRGEFATPAELAKIGADGYAARVELEGGSYAELRMPREGFERIASSSNLLRVLQLALPLAVSCLFLAAGLRLRKSART